MTLSCQNHEYLCPQSVQYAYKVHRTTISLSVNFQSRVKNWLTGDTTHYLSNYMYATNWSMAENINYYQWELNCIWLILYILHGWTIEMCKLNNLRSNWMLITNRYVANKNIFVGVGIQHEYHIVETWGYKTRSVYNKKNQYGPDRLSFASLIVSFWC